MVALDTEPASIVAPQRSSDKLRDGRHPHFELDPHRRSIFDATTLGTPSQLSAEPIFAQAFSDDTLPQDEDDRFDYHSRHRNPAYTESWASADNAERDVENEASEKAKQDPRQETERDENSDLVNWDGPDDPENPMNWSTSKKWSVTLTLGFMTFCITFASSVFSTATQVTAVQYGVSEIVTTLGTSLFVLVSAPFSFAIMICTKVYRALGSVHSCGVLFPSSMAV